eukprot:SAG31_NODE_47647_length_230_cov_10.954198_1_plen_67_part_01
MVRPCRCPPQCQTLCYQGRPGVFFRNLLLTRSGGRWPGPLMLLLLRDYATFEYAKFAILERDYAAHY